MAVKKLIHMRLLGGAHAPTWFPSLNTDAPEGALDFHPALTALKRLYDMGMVKIILCTGNEDPNGSHFQMRDMNDERGNFANGPTGQGWADHVLAQTFDEADTEIVAAIVGDNVKPRLLQGGRSKTVAIESPNAGASQSSILALINEAQALDDLPDNDRDYYLAEMAAHAKKSGVVLNFSSRASAAIDCFIQFPHCQLVCVDSGGYDTHEDHDDQEWSANEAFNGVLSGLAAQLGWFASDVGNEGGTSGVFYDTLEDDTDDVIIDIETDFSRALLPTVSNGYSHGRGGFRLLIGRSVVGGVIGSLPTITSEDSDRLLEGSGVPQFLPVEYPRETITLALIRHLGWNSTHAFTKSHVARTDLFDEPLPAAYGPEWISPSLVGSGVDYEPPIYSTGGGGGGTPAQVTAAEAIRVLKERLLAVAA